MKRNLCGPILLAVFVLGGATAALADPAGPVVWRDLDAALAESAATGKPVVIHFTAEWCGWCKKMKKEVYSQADVAAVLNNSFVPAMVDTDERPDLEAAYGVRGLPTIMFISAAGEGITYIPGYVDAPTFRKVLQWVVTGAYATQSFDEFAATER